MAAGAWAAGAWAAGAWAAGAWAFAGAVAGAEGVEAWLGAAGALAAGAGALAAGALDGFAGEGSGAAGEAGTARPRGAAAGGAETPRLLTSRGRDVAVPVSSIRPAAFAAPGVVFDPCFAGAFFWGFSGGASSGCTDRRRPSASAFLRTRSACASSIEEEWLFTPMPRARQRSRASLFVSPSSRPNS